MEEKDTELLQRIFKQIYEAAYLGENSEIYDILFECEAGGEIEDLTSEIFELRQETSPDFNRYEESKKYDANWGYKVDAICQRYESLIYAFSYKMFLYGLFLNLNSTENSKDLIANKNSESVAQKMKLISDFIDKEEDMETKRRIAKNIVFKEYKKECIKRYEFENSLQPPNKGTFSNLISRIKTFFK